jgi:small subunit ribosomal protein S17
MKKEIFGMKQPQETCNDKKCPFHGEVSVKKETIKGVVVKKDINGSATISWFRSYPVPKYERFEIRRSRLRTHNPKCIDAQVGDNVLVARTRPLSKTKNHVVIGILEGKKGEKELQAESAAKEHGKKKKDKPASDKSKVNYTEEPVDEKAKEESKSQEAEEKESAEKSIDESESKEELEEENESS